MNKKFEQLIYKELDGKLTSKEIKLLEDAVKLHPEIEKERKQLIKMRDMVASSRKEDFKPFFETRVMQKINSSEKQLGLPDLLAEVMTRQFKKILVPAMVIVLAIAVYNLGSAGVFSFDSLLGVPEVSLADSVDPINYLSLE